MHIQDKVEFQTSGKSVYSLVIRVYSDVEKIELCDYSPTSPHPFCGKNPLVLLLYGLLKWRLWVTAGSLCFSSVIPDSSVKTYCKFQFPL